jgi:hypothetical protein
MCNCLNFDKGSIEMNGTATLIYDLSKPEQVMAHKYALKGLEACQMLESLKAATAGYQAYKGLSESVLADIIQDLSKWEDVKL